MTYREELAALLELANLLADLIERVAARNEPEKHAKPVISTSRQTWN